MEYTPLSTKNPRKLRAPHLPRRSALKDDEIIGAVVIYRKEVAALQRGADPWSANSPTKR